ncbi:MAG: hypothetical protein V4634_04660 [Pseudomonadota bacterium]
MSEVFTPHGQFRLHAEGRIVVSEVTGPWNVELVQNWATEVRPYSLQMQPGGPWGGIAIIRESMLCTPDAMDALGKIVAYGVENFGCIAQVVVASPDVAGRGVVEPAFQRIYEGVCAYNFFYEYEEARDWLNRLILERSSA